MVVAGAGLERGW